jgi:hypothetical protein
MFTHGYLEVIHAPETPQGPFSHKELLRAAEAAQCRNTGWPIGVVLTRREEYRPKPVASGILAKIVSDTVDYWFLKNDGAFYFARTFVEDSAHFKESRLQGEEVRIIAFDTRTWRVAEAFLHASKLYEALGFGEEISINFQITHKGLKGRVMTATDYGRAFTLREGRTCELQDVVDWNPLQPIQLGRITPNLKDYTYEVVSHLFDFFDYADIPRQVIDGIVDNFLGVRK